MKKFINILAAAVLGLGGVTSCTLDAVNYVEKHPRTFLLHRVMLLRHLRVFIRI